MPAPHRIAAAAATLAVALAPASALAQNGAGDEQYTDPFANGSQQPAKPKQQQPTTTQQQTAPAPTTTQQTTPQPQPTTQQASPSTQRSGDPNELPRTGFDLIPLALLGVALVAAGLLLRRRPSGAGGRHVAAGGGSRFRSRDGRR